LASSHSAKPNFHIRSLNGTNCSFLKLQQQQKHPPKISQPTSSYKFFNDSSNPLPIAKTLLYKNQVTVLGGRPLSPPLFFFKEDTSTYVLVT